MTKLCQTAPTPYPKPHQEPYPNRTKPHTPNMPNRSNHTHKTYDCQLTWQLTVTAQFQEVRFSVGRELGCPEETSIIRTVAKFCKQHNQVAMSKIDLSTGIMTHPDSSFAARAVSHEGATLMCRHEAPPATRVARTRAPPFLFFEIFVWFCFACFAPRAAGNPKVDDLRSAEKPCIRNLGADCHWDRGSPEFLSGCVTDRAATRRSP